MLTTDRFTFPIFAGPNESFEVDAFASCIGTDMQMQTATDDWEIVHLIDAKVAEDGRSVDVTVEVPSGVALMVDTLRVLETTDH